MALTVAFSLPTFAADETNSLGVLYSAVLDNETLNLSDQDQTVQMTLKTNKAVTLDGMGLTIVYDAPIELVKIEGGDKININASNYNMANGKVSWSSDDAENLNDITNLLKVTFKVPAGTEAGSYRVGVKELELTKDYGTIWEPEASAAATLTVVGDVHTEGYGAVSRVRCGVCILHGKV